jgi:hypothetical protein
MGAISSCRVNAGDSPTELHRVIGPLSTHSVGSTRGVLLLGLNVEEEKLVSTTARSNHPVIERPVQGSDVARMLVERAV